MLNWKQLFRCGVQMLLTGATLHGLSQMALAQDVESAKFQTSDVSRGKQVSLVADEKAPPPPTDQPPVQTEGPGVAKVPGCTSIAGPGGACANGSCTARAGACGPSGCHPGMSGACGANGCPSCRVGRGGHGAGNGYTLNDANRAWSDAGHAWSGAGRATNHAMGQAFGSVWHGPECDWNDEMNGSAWSGHGHWNSPCPEHGRMNCPHCCGWLDDQWAMFNARNRQQGEILRAHIHGKFAYFHPMGNGGEGVPPFGCYHLVYAANPNYFDPRDGQIYAAQGWGVPMSVPLAPTVRHTMNYSTGIPSSRLTPISNVVPPRGVRHW